MNERTRTTSRAERWTWRRKWKAIGSSLGAAGAAGIALIFLAAPVSASGGVYLEPSTLSQTGFSTWAASCNDQATGWHYNYNSGTYYVDDHGPANWNGEFDMAMSSESGVGNFQWSNGHVQTTDWFDVGPSGGSYPGCYTPGSTTSVEVIYYWDISAASMIDWGCASGGSISGSVSLDLHGDVHKYGGWANGGAHTSWNVAKLTKSISCSSPGPGGISEVSTTGWVQKAVFVNATLYSGTYYDFWSSITVDQNLNAGSTSGDAVAAFTNVTAVLAGIACSAC